MNARVILILAAALLLPAAAGAQQPVAQPVYVAQPAPAQGNVQVVEEPAPDVRVGRGIEYGAHLLVPIFLTNSVWDFDPGIGLQGRIGYEFGAFTVEGNIGFTFNSLSDFDGWAVTDIWLGAGARYSFFNPSAFVPFVGAGLALNFWGLSVDETGYGDYSSTNGKLGLGFNALIGAAYEITAQFAIEAGVQGNYTLPGDFWYDGNGDKKGQFWLTPFAGATLYY